MTASSLVYLVFLILCLQGSSAAPGHEQTPLASDARIAAHWDWEECDYPDKYPVRIKDIAVSPDPPKPGQNLTVTVKADVKGPVEEGAIAEVTVKLGIIKLLTKQFDLCEEARNADLSVQCPVDEGEYEITHTVELPKEIPPAAFRAEVQAFSAEDEDLACLVLKADFRP